jgi:hypothetical protein
MALVGGVAALGLVRSRRWCDGVAALGLVRSRRWAWCVRGFSGAGNSPFRHVCSAGTLRHLRFDLIIRRVNELSPKASCDRRAHIRLARESLLALRGLALRSLLNADIPAGAVGDHWILTGHSIHTGHCRMAWPVSQVPVYAGQYHIDEALMLLQPHQCFIDVVRPGGLGLCLRVLYGRLGLLRNLESGWARGTIGDPVAARSIDRLQWFH